VQILDPFSLKKAQVARMDDLLDDVQIDASTDRSNSALLDPFRLSRRGSENEAGLDNSVQISR